MRAVMALLVLGLSLLLLAVWLRDEPPPAADAGLNVTNLLGAAASADGFARATEPGGIELPRDHDAHPDFRTEWWYFTGNLSGGEREYGYQLTFFRFALAPDAPTRDSPWASRQLYMAHFAITDVAGNRHQAVERLARGAMELAGVRVQPFAVWLDDWRVESAGEGFLPLRLTASDPDTGLALELELGPGKPPVLQGEAGLSAKGPEPGNASYYYSYTRLPTRGRLRVDGEEVSVAGHSWLDREWSTSSLGAGVVGWDWLGLQLDDGRDLMLYSLRDASGEPGAFSSGSLVAANGAVRRLRREDFILEPLSRWRSPSSGVEWPVAWRLRVPSAGIDLEARALVADQEQSLSVRYWEGAVALYAAGDGDRLGSGYLEMTGYTPRPDQANSAR